MPESLVFAFALVPAAAAAQTASGSFQRSLSVNGQADVEVVTGSGSIEVRQGRDGQVEINGQIKAGNWGSWNRSALSPQEQVKRLEANPPVQQTGNVIRIGHIADKDLQNGVSISYTLTVPANSKLLSKTGSGSQRIDGVRGEVQTSTGSGSIVVRQVGGGVSASTGSGSIEADGVDGSFRASTGSGGIQATGVTGAITAKTGSGSINVGQVGKGDVDVSSSSGTVRIHGIHGALRASTTSGGLHVEGEPTGEWELSSSSGSVRVDLPDGRGFELDARTSSGNIDVGMPVSVVGSLSRRSLRGSVGGGGPRLQVRTSSGSIDIK